MADPVGPWDGPSYHYRDADTHCPPSGYVFGLLMRHHLQDGVTFGVAGTIPIGLT